MTGRRPTRSESAPSTGANTNCIAAHTVPNRPTMPAPLASLPPSSWMTSLGNTGAMIPSASMSSSTVPKMNQKVARRTAGRGGLEPPDEPGDGGAATLLQVPLERVAQRLRLHVGVVVVHEVQYGAEHAGRPLLVAHTDLAGRHRRRHLIATHGGRVTPQALVTILSERRAHAGAQREHPGEIAVAPQREARVVGAGGRRRGACRREHTRAEDARRGDGEHTDRDESGPAGQFHASHHNRGGGPDGSVSRRFSRPTTRRRCSLPGAR